MDQGWPEIFEKGGTTRFTYHHVDVGLTGICTVIVCEAHGHAKHANTRGLGHAPQEIKF